MTSEKNENIEFEFLIKAAENMGAAEVRVIPVSDIVIEDLVQEKCKAGCISYGKKLTCPPYVPAPDEFKKKLGEYRFALLVKFRPKAGADPDIIRSIYRHWPGPADLCESTDKNENFWEECFKGSKNILPVMLELEKTAFKRGYSRALAFASGSCKICEICNVKGGVCKNPKVARIPDHAVGINIKKTVKNIGMHVNTSPKEKREPVAVLLID